MNRNIYSTYRHSAGGGGKNSSRLLHYLSKQNNCTVDAFFFKYPHYFTYTTSPVIVHTPISPDVLKNTIDINLIKNYFLTDKIIAATQNTTNPTLFGSHLLPYCNILLDVKTQLLQLYRSNPKLIIHPVGSDIWQVGIHFKPRIKWLLENPLVDLIVTYSDSFIEEIQQQFNITKKIHILPPMLEDEIFFPLNLSEISERRKQLNFNDDYFIIHHHSRMSKVKCPEIVLDISQKAAELIPEKCVLIMTGPIPYEEVRSLNLEAVNSSPNDLFKYKTELKNLTVYWTGFLADVTYLMQVSDVELNASLHDSFNISLLEAAACAVPVVTSDVVGIGKHIIKANAGVCFPTEKLKFDELNKIMHSNQSKTHLFDIDFAISAIKKLAKEKSTTRIKHIEAANYFKEKFNPQKTTEEFFKISSNDK